MTTTQPLSDGVLAPDGNRSLMRVRIERLIAELSAADGGASARSGMHGGRWRKEIEVAGVDSGQLAYADHLIDQAHSILRQDPTRTAAAIAELERAREKLS